MGSDDPGRLIGPDGEAWPEAHADFEDEVVRLVNLERARGGNCGARGSFPPSGPLRMHPILRTVARAHSKDMAVRAFFAHTNPDGATPFDRIRAAGYVGSPQGENIAAGQRTPAAVMMSWMGSDGHCANILNPSYRDIGVGYTTGGRYGTLWTQVFGGGR
jgi:uncharacterized protein YkwD